MSDWYLNGERCNGFAPESRGLQYGDGVFETVAIRRGKPRLWSLHVDRLNEACSRLGLDTPDSGECLALIEAAAEPYGVAKVIVAAHGGERGYARTSTKVDVLLKVFRAQPMPASLFADGVELVTCQTRLATGSPVAGLKTLNRIEQVLARNEVSAAGVFEGLTQDAAGRLICGTMSNLFVVKDKQIITPDLKSCGVRGVMRRHVIETLAANSRDVIVGELSSLNDVDEVFLSNSQFGVLPVRQCDDLSWPVGNVTREVASLLSDSGVTEWSS